MFGSDIFGFDFLQFNSSSKNDKLWARRVIGTE